MYAVASDSSSIGRRAARPIAKPAAAASAMPIRPTMIETVSMVPSVDSVGAMEVATTSAESWGITQFGRRNLGWSGME
jgi:hypothetical protein